MPEERRGSVLIPIRESEEDAQCCGSYRGMELVSHTIKVLERIIEASLRDSVEIGERQYGFVSGRGTAGTMFSLGMLTERCREGQGGLYCVFVDLERAYDGVPREELWYCMKKSGMVEGVCDLYRICVRKAKQWWGMQWELQRVLRSRLDNTRDQRWVVPVCSDSGRADG